MTQHETQPLWASVREIYQLMSPRRRRHLYVVLLLVRDLKNVWAYCDGTRDTIAIAELLDLPPAGVAEVQQQLLHGGVVEKVA